MTTPQAFTVDMHIDAVTVQAWADLSGDYNRLHVDPEFAATTPYGRCIAHGPLLASIVAEMLADRVGGDRSSTARTSFRFVAPVYVPSTIVATVEMPTPDTASVVCTDEGGSTVLRVEASWNVA